MADGQIQGQVVGVTMPDASALGINQGESGSAPPQPGPFRHQRGSD